MRGHLFCIEDPFELTHDLGRVIGRDTLSDVRSELDRAANLLHDERPWATICEEYVPPEKPPKEKKEKKEGDGKGGGKEGGKGGGKGSAKEGKQEGGDAAGTPSSKPDVAAVATD